MIYECENCGKEFEVAEPVCPKCHSGDVIEYNEKNDMLKNLINQVKDLTEALINEREKNKKAIEYIKHDLEMNKDYPGDELDKIYTKKWVNNTCDDLLEILGDKE